MFSDVRGEHFDDLGVVVFGVAGDPFKSVDTAEPHIDRRRVAELLDRFGEAVGYLSGSVEREGACGVERADHSDAACEQRERGGAHALSCGGAVFGFEALFRRTSRVRV